MLVSFDAFVCGLSLSYNPNNALSCQKIKKCLRHYNPNDALSCQIKNTAFFAVYSGVVSFIGSYVFSMFGTALSGFANEKAAAAYSGYILIAISMFSFLESAEIIKFNFNSGKSEFILKLIACSIVAVDASFGALSLSLMGNSDYLCIAAVFGIMHAIMITLGTLISENRHFKNILKKFEYLPMIIMFLLGLSKIIF